MGIGIKLKDLIDSKGTNVNEVANATGVNPQTIYSIIKRDSEKASIDDLGKLAFYLGVDLNYFYMKEEPHTGTCCDGLSDHEREIALAYRRASEDDKAVVNAVLKKYVDPQNAIAGKAI